MQPVRPFGELTTIADRYGSLQRGKFNEIKLDLNSPLGDKYTAEMEEFGLQDTRGFQLVLTGVHSFSFKLARLCSIEAAQWPARTFMAINAMLNPALLIFVSKFTWLLLSA